MKIIIFLSSWVKNLALVLIIISILEMILPNNKTKKYVKMIMGLYILFSIISPFIENNYRFNLDEAAAFSQYIEESSSTSAELNQTSMDNRLNEIYKEELQKDITKKIEEKGYDVESCKVIAHISEYDSGIETINLKVNKRIVDNDNTQQETSSIENKIVTEIQKIQKIQITVTENNEDEDNNNTQEIANITKTDIKIIEEFLIKEYGVSKQCLKIN